MKSLLFAISISGLPAMDSMAGDEDVGRLVKHLQRNKLL